MGIEIPRTYLIFERVLLDERARLGDFPVISRAELLSHGSYCDLKDPASVLASVKFMNSVGSLVYFDTDPLLRNLIILDPQWLTRMMASLFTTKHRFVSGGILYVRDVLQIWKQFPSYVHAALLHLLARFQIAYPLPEQLWAKVIKLIPSSAAAASSFSPSLHSFDIHPHHRPRGLCMAPPFLAVRFLSFS